MWPSAGQTRQDDLKGIVLGSEMKRNMQDTEVRVHGVRVIRFARYTGLPRKTCKCGILSISVANVTFC